MTGQYTSILYVFAPSRDVPGINIVDNVSMQAEDYGDLMQRLRHWVEEREANGDGH